MGSFCEGQFMNPAKWNIGMTDSAPGMTFVEKPSQGSVLMDAKHLWMKTNRSAEGQIDRSLFLCLALESEMPI